MLEKVKSGALVAVSVLAFLLFGWISYLGKKLGAQQQQIDLDKAKQGVADALQKRVQDATDVKTADDQFDAVASKYVPPKS